MKEKLITGIIVAVGAIIQDEEGRILLVKHKPERGGFWQGKWICPGGKLELGEEIKAGIEREVREETNLEIELLQPLSPAERIIKSGKETTLHVIYLDYLAKVVAGELRPADDIAEARWVTKENLPQIWEELHEDTKQILRIGGII